MKVIRAIWAWLLSLFIPPSPPATIKPPAEFDWFVWESEQIQRNGYVWWLDHWRYEGEPGAYPDPTPEQRRKVFEMSSDKARARMGEERLEKIVADAVSKMESQGFTEQAAFERVMAMGQDPVQWAINFTIEK